MSKKIIRKPTRDEQRFINLIRAEGGLDIYKYDWPIVETLAREGLISLSPPFGPGKAFKRAVLPGMEDW